MACHIEWMETTAFFNGAWVAEQDLRLPIDDLGFLLGATVVERMRTFAHEIFRLKDHLDRLRRSLEIVGWDADEICGKVAVACKEFVERNESLIETDDDWTIVAFVTPGKTADAARPTICVHGSPLPFHDWARKYTDGVEAKIVDIRQTPNECWPAELKCRSRMHYYLAERQVEAATPGAKAILLDQGGLVGEGTTANLVAWYADRGLITPRLTKVLPGVSQQVLFELADSLDIPHAEDDILPEKLAAADEVFFTSTSSCLLPIVRLSGKPVGGGEPGIVFRRLLAAWSQLVGVDIAEQARRSSLQ